MLYLMVSKESIKVNHKVILNLFIQGEFKESKTPNKSQYISIRLLLIFQIRYKWHNQIVLIDSLVTASIMPITLWTKEKKTSTLTITILQDTIQVEFALTAIKPKLAQFTIFLRAKHWFKAQEPITTTKRKTITTVPLAIHLRSYTNLFRLSRVTSIRHNTTQQTMPQQASSCKVNSYLLCKKLYLKVQFKTVLY